MTSYIKAIRWASDRIGNSQVIGFVTNAGFVEANTADGLRRCLAEEFSNIYVFRYGGTSALLVNFPAAKGAKFLAVAKPRPLPISLLVKNLKPNDL